MVYVFVVWFHGVIVSWFYGIMVLQFYGFMTGWLLGGSRCDDGVWFYGFLVYTFKV